MKDALGQDLMAGDWVGYPGHQGSGSAYMSVGVVVQVLAENDALWGEGAAARVRIVPYGQLRAGEVSLHKSCDDAGLTRPFYRPEYMSGTLLLPPCALLQTDQAAAFRTRALVRFGVNGAPTRCPACLNAGFTVAPNEPLDGRYVAVTLCGCSAGDPHRRMAERGVKSQRYMWLASDPTRTGAQEAERVALREELAGMGVTFDWEPEPMDNPDYGAHAGGDQT